MVIRAFYWIVSKLYGVASPHKRDVFYGRSQILRTLLGYRWPRKISFVLEHGVDAVQIDEFEKVVDANHVVFSKKKAADLAQLGKNAYVIPDPFTYVVNSDFTDFCDQAVLPIANKGALYFYSHSTKSVLDQNSPITYLNVISNFVKRKGIEKLTICLHFSDVDKGVHKIVERSGFDWISVPKYPVKKFPIRFFELILQYESFYSNTPGSYLYYLVFLGKDFELINFKPKLRNVSDTAQLSDFVGFFDEYPNDVAYDLFGEGGTASNDEKREFVLSLLGYSSYEGPEEVRTIIRKALNE
jgi:hypothetical protein